MNKMMQGNVYKVNDNYYIIGQYSGVYNYYVFIVDPKGRITTTLKNESEFNNIYPIYLGTGDFIETLILLKVSNYPEIFEGKI